MHNHAQMDVPPDPGHVAVRGGVVEHMELGGGAVERQAVVNLCGQVLGGPPSTGMTPSQGMDDTVVGMLMVKLAQSELSINIS